MKKYLFLLISFFLFTGCTMDAQPARGVHFMMKKYIAENPNDQEAVDLYNKVKALTDMQTNMLWIEAGLEDADRTNQSHAPKLREARRSLVQEGNPEYLELRQQINELKVKETFYLESKGVEFPPVQKKEKK